MRSWEVWALWVALLTGFGVLGYTALTWPSTAPSPSSSLSSSPVAAVEPREAVAPPAPRTLPWLDALAPLVNADNANLALAPVAATEAAIQAATQAGDATAAALAAYVATAAPATAAPSGNAPLASVSPADTGLPVFPGAMPVPKQSSQSASGGTVVTLTTRAPLSAVVNFYRQGLPQGQQAARSVVASPTSQDGLDLREVDTDRRTVRSVQVAEVDSTVYIRLSLIRTP